jgi:uncharacterized protein with ParB-like and HNH nuclease domain
MNSTCCPKTIYELKECQFFIPAYQRGYRWSTQQVNELLNDIWDFSKKKSSAEEFYCLQPVIVKEICNDENGKLWEVIDGQQRLTTIHLILTCLNSMLPEKEKQFSIDYETRKNSMEFLRTIDESHSNENIDFYHMYNAYQNIKQWIDEKQESERVSKNVLVMRLLPVFSENVKVIWYEVDSMTNSSEVFTRVNMGKIPLTNAELIKALLLNESNFDSNSEVVRIRQLEIAGEWDRMEYALQNEDFWYFLTNGALHIENRIDYIFKLMALEKNKEYQIKIVEEELLPFHVFNKWFSQIGEPSKAIEKLWKEIKDYFLTFEEWYQEKNLYHLIGFLITIGKPISELKADSSRKTKTEFIDYLKKQVAAKLNYKKIFSKNTYLLEDLDYTNEVDRRYIRNILLLFNIITLNNNDEANSRFPFKSYKQEQWDLEHIHSVKSQISERQHEKAEWINNALKVLDETNDLYNECKNIVQMSNESLYDSIIDKILNHFAENNLHEDINNISNMAMLDADTNRSYGNSVFSIKRKTILQKDKEGVFIPQCTKNVFLKYYNLDVEQLSLWSKADRDSYIQNIKLELFEYLPKEEDIQ